MISGNYLYGIQITGAATTGNVIAGDFIGLDRTGSSRWEMVRPGWCSMGRDGQHDRRPDRRTRNVIGGNGNRGVFINTPAGSSSPTTGNVIEGNYIGTDASGLVPMGNISTTPSRSISRPATRSAGPSPGRATSSTPATTRRLHLRRLPARSLRSAAGNLIAGNIIGLAADGGHGAAGLRGRR